MVNRNNALVATSIDVLPEFKGRVAAAYQKDRFGKPEAFVDQPSAFSTSPPLPVGFNDDGQKSVPAAAGLANAFVGEGLGGTWFELFHVLPRDVVLGNVLSTQQVQFEVYSAFRRADHTWDAFTNNGGAGITMLNLPTLPFTFKPQNSGGLNLVLEVSTSGDPTVDSTLDFDFDVSMIDVEITLQRVVLFDLQPEMPYTEDLEFLTDIMVHKDGTEQRAALRKNPRQFFSWDFILDDGRERSRIHNFLFDWQANIFGIPIWHELTRLSVAASATDQTITVQSTAYADYRTANGNLVLIYTDDGTFDVLPLNALTATTLTFDSALLNNYPVGTIVSPLRTGVLDEQFSGSRWPSSDARLKLRFRVLDNDSDLADTSAWSSFNSKVLLTECNGVRGSMPESFERNIVVIDGATGITDQNSPWPTNRRVSRKTFLAAGKQATWEVRQLLHALRGQQISWYLPAFSQDLAPTTPLSSGSNQLDVTNVGYTRFVKSRPGRNVIQVTFNTGDPPLLRTIISSTETSATEEELILDSTWPSTFAVAYVDRIEFVEKVRFDSDRFRFRHERGDRLVRISAPVVAVLE